MKRYIHEDEDSLKPINYDSIADYVNFGNMELTMCMTVALRISGGYKDAKMSSFEGGMVFELGGWYRAGSGN